jgi:hypothetical protein
VERFPVGAVEYASYEAQHAERRYRAVDPDNRLVARGLEREWEECLKALEVAKADLARGQPPCDGLSRKEEGVETYKIDCSRNPEAFPEPNWPSQSLSDLIGTTFESLLVATAATDHGAAGASGPLRRSLPKPA